jgi:hypothetical protein
MDALQTHRFLMRIALAAVNLFAWIFVFQYIFARTSELTDALMATAALYVVAQIVILVVTPLSAVRLRNGIIRPMTLGIVLASMAFGILALSFSGFLGTSIVLGIFLYAILRGLYHAIYWLPYSVDSAIARERRPLTRIVQEGVLACIPAIAGLVLTAGVKGLNILFFGAATLALLSIVPLRYIREIHEGYSWGYAQSFRMLATRRHRRLVTTAFLDGVSGATLLLFWPIAILLLVGWSYAMLGIIMSVTYLLVFFTRSYVRGALKKVQVEGSALVHAFLAVSGWVLRLVVATPLGVVLVDTYYYTGTEVRGTGISTLTFDQSADRGSYVDEYTVLKEIGLALGKISICGVSMLVAALTTLPITFIIIFLIAAAASGVSVYLTRKAHLHA